MSWLAEGVEDSPRMRLRLFRDLWSHSPWSFQPFKGYIKLCHPRLVPILLRLGVFKRAQIGPGEWVTH